MSNTSLLLPPLPLAVPVSVRTVRRPFYFESQGNWLFAWLHCPESASCWNQGVILCPPIGYEQVHAHRSLRHLADAVAAAGFPVVRFDYHGTGDSAGTGEEPHFIETCLANIRDARAWLQHRLGCQEITLIGLRIGATLATHVATEQRVDNLLLWAPVVKGRSYVREMKALSLTSTDPNQPSSAVHKGIEAAGFVLTEQTIQDLNRLDLLQARPLCSRVLVIGRDDMPSDSALRSHLENLGIEAEQCVQPGYTELMAEPHDSMVPRQAIAKIVDWLVANSLGEVSAPIEGGIIEASPDIGMIPHSPFAVDGSFFSPTVIRERAFFIAAQPKLFGILTEPSAPPLDDLPMIVLLNAGSSYRVGPNRLSVFLARQFATRAFRTLRLDLNGLGDSVCSDSARENDPYPATAFRDIAITLDYLRSSLGVRRVVLMGLCSGAYAAFQAASQFTTPVLVESVLINPLTFFWREGMSMEASPVEQIKSFQESLSSAWQPRKWLKLLSGRSKIGLAGVIRILMQRLRLRTPSSRHQSVRVSDSGGAEYPSHPQQEDLPGDLERIVKWDRQLTCFFSRSDPGYGLLLLYARQKAKELQRMGRLKFHFVDDADHTFSRRAARLALGEAITEHLARRYLR